MTRWLWIVLLLCASTAWAQETYSLLAEWTDRNNPPGLTKTFEIGWRFVPSESIGQGQAFVFTDTVLWSEMAYSIPFPIDVTDEDRMVWSVRACNCHTVATCDQERVCSNWIDEQRIDFFAANSVVLPSNTVVLPSNTLTKPSRPTDPNSTVVAD